MPHKWTKIHPLHPVSSIILFLGLSEVKRDTGSSQMHSFHFTEEHRGREGNLSPKLSVCLSLYISNCVSFSPSSRLEWAGVRLWPQEALNSLQNGRCLMGRHTGPQPHPLATRKWHLTPSCVYIRPWKWEIVMSHSGCVFTLRSHARKEISHGLLKVARWERIAAATQSCSDLPLRARIYFMSSLLQRPSTNRKQQR